MKEQILSTNRSINLFYDGFTFLIKEKKPASITLTGFCFVYGWFHLLCSSHHFALVVCSDFIGYRYFI
jgi:hypothetical protein